MVDPIFLSLYFFSFWVHFVLHSPSFNTMCMDIYIVNANINQCIWVYPILKLPTSPLDHHHKKKKKKKSSDVLSKKKKKNLICVSLSTFIKFIYNSQIYLCEICRIRWIISSSWSQNWRKTWRKGRRGT